MHLLPAADRLVQPWKNGGGTTSEVAASPPGVGLEAFDWRISMASVATPGRFSYFDGVDRTLAVIEGRLGLAFDSQAELVELTAASRPYAFPGDIGCFGAPVGGEVIDLNLMVRRGRWTGTIERLASPERVSIAPAARSTIILFRGEGRVRWRSETVLLKPWDAVRLDDAADEPIALAVIGDTYVISLSIR
ncbi:HutD family protein [Sphingosinicellaceae bacterium]|nr:HutD family protein [Sphingosinicellaceae bacterium]